MPKVCIRCAIVQEETAFAYDRTRSNPERRNTVCKDCCNAFNRSQRSENNQEYNAKIYARRAERGEDFQVIKRRWNTANRQKIREQQRARYKVRRVQILAKNYARLQRRKGLPYNFSSEDQQFCRQYFQYACAVCGREEGLFWRIVFDHWHPLISENCPGTIPTNMIPLCHSKRGSYQSCNTTKRHREAKAWLIQRFGKHKAMILLRKIETYFAVVRNRHNTLLSSLA